jgi:hypothetical protein
VDEAHDTLSGPATQKILYREHFEFADSRYERLANISVAHIYNLRKYRSYREKRMAFQKTRPTPVSIGEHRRQEPEGRPGSASAIRSFDACKDSRHTDLILTCITQNCPRFRAVYL